MFQTQRQEELYGLHSPRTCGAAFQSGVAREALSTLALPYLTFTAKASGLLPSFRPEG